MPELNAPEVEPVIDPVVETPVETEPGDIPVDPAVETPAEVPQEAPVVEQELFDLPDGRKVDAETLAKEWRDNFMPEYTRKSQLVAELKKAPEAAPKPESLLDKEDWAPSSTRELADAMKMEIWQSIQEEATREEREAKAREDFVEKEKEYLKGVDPNVNIPQVMAYAAKRSHTSLVTAYNALQDIEEAARRAEDRVQKNLKLRAGEPVGASTQPVTGDIQFPPDVRTPLEKALYVIRQNK